MTSHRGLSAVVGTVFLIAVVMGALSYVSYSLDMMGNFSESLIINESRQQDKQKEAFDVTSIAITAGKLDGVIKNSGEIPVELKTLYIDEQGVNDVVQKFTLNTSISPGNTVNLIDLIDYDINATKGYNMKVVSSRGEVNSFYVNSPASENVLMQIRAIPTYVPTTFATTVLVSVINNMSNNNVLYNISPGLNITDVVGTNVGLLINGPTPIDYPVLAPGDVAVFEYTVKMIGEVDDMVLFNATLINGNSANFVTTTATVKEVAVATQSGTALESFGLSTDINNISNILNLHAETSLTPNGELQLSPSDISGGGAEGILETTSFVWISGNGTENVVVDPGAWNATFAYYNELVPSGITEPSFAFMMECNNCPSSLNTIDSTGNLFQHDLEASSDPIYYSSGGPDGKSYFSYDSNDKHYFEGDPDWNDYDQDMDIEGDAATTATWFRIPPASGSLHYMPIVRFGDEDDGSDDEYEIAWGDGGSGSHGNIVFRYSTDLDNDETKCETDGTYEYDDGLWHFAVAARDGDDDCKLYVDGVLADDTEECNGCGGSGLMSVSGTYDVYVGYDGCCGNLVGDVAAFMHWQGVELSAADIWDLYNTNYGTNATRAQVKVELVNGLGNSVTTSLYDETYSFDYHDVSQRSEALAERVDLNYLDSDHKKYLPGNFTFSTIASINMTAGDRLRYSITWDGDSQNLPFHFRYDDDDSNFASNDMNGILQTPIADPNWPGFVSFAKDDEVSYIVFNNGPNGAWFTYGGTRFVVTTIDAAVSYGAHVVSINATGDGGPVNIDQDSIYFPDQSYAEIKFHKLSNPPKTTGALTAPPAGQYIASVFLNGYDDKGEVFLRTIRLGTVNITN